MKQITCFFVFLAIVCLINHSVFGQPARGRQAIPIIAPLQSLAVAPVPNQALACPTTATLYVDSSRSSSGDGSSWATAYKELRDAMATAVQCSNVATIFVAKGTYKPTADNNRDGTFLIVRGLKVYGGYPSGGGTRNLAVNSTVMSGDIGNPNNNTDNSYHVLVAADRGSLTDSVVVDGFAITAGNANGDGSSDLNSFSFPRTYGGGAVLLTNSSSGGLRVALRNCIISNNTATSYAGGIFNQVASPITFTNCIFSTNRIIDPNAGGALLNSASSPTITNCTFSANTAAYGAGIINFSSSLPVINNCIIWANNSEGINGSATVSYSDVQGDGVYPGIGNINADPRFVNPADPDGPDNRFATADDGLRLQPASPAINKGSNAAVPAGTATDIAGSVRIQQGTVDMGAYESPYPTPVFLSVNDVSKAEGNSGTTVFTFTVSLSGPAPAGGVNFTIATADSTATAPADYTARAAATRSIAAGASSDTFNVSVKGDLLIEPNEYFKVKIINASGTGIIITDSTGVGTIANDDACPSSATLYVDSSRSSSGNGGSWATAYKELREALTITAQCPGIFTVLVAKGTYKPTGDIDRDSAFTILKGGIKLYGGYPSGGGTRNITANPTIMSGEIGIQSDTSDNSYHVMVIAGLSNSADSVVVDGFTVTRGRANGTNSVKGYNGAGVQRDEGSSVYLHTNNGAGGKIAFRNCVFSRNSASSYGAGFYNQFSSPAISNCVFSFNTVASYGGGGMFNVNQSSPKITNCVFTGNSSPNGGGILNNTSSPVITNCTFSANSASGNGGGISNINPSSPVITNCIIWGNSSGIANNASTPAVTYSDVQGAGVYPGAGNINLDPRFVNPGDPNGADNVFATADDGLKLQQGSPAVNKGRNDSLPAGITTDITGAARIQQGIVDMGAYESPFAPAISLTIDDVAKAEGNSGTTPFSFIVRLSAAAPPGGVSFNIVTANIVATQPSDYNLKYLVATIPAGDSIYTFTVLVNGDTMVEPDETFAVNLSNVSGFGAVIADAQGIGTILNDDIDPCATDNTPPTITPKNITVYLNRMGQATIQPFDVIQSVTDNCFLDSSSIRISQSQFSCADVGDSSATPIIHQAYVATTNTGNQAFNGELGMEFRVNKTITINQLGAFDHQSNGISGAFNGGIRVAIFNKLTQQIVPGLDATITGLADGLASNHRLKNIAPIRLLPGNYVVVAKGYNSLELNGNSGLGSPVTPGDSASGAISFTGSGLYGILGDASTFSFPVNPDAGPAYRYLAGTFSFSTDSSITTPVATTYQAYTTAATAGNQAYEGELGLDFSVTTSLGITVRRLGTFDHQADGINGSQNGGVRVAIFNRDTRQIVSGLDATVTGLADTLSAGYRLSNIAPVYLPAGNYTIVAKGYNQNELNGNSGYGTPPASTQNGGGAIVYSGTGLYGTQATGFSYPTNADAGPATRYLAGTFTYTLGSGSMAATLNGKMAGNQLLAAAAHRQLANAAAADAGAHQAYSTPVTTGNQAYEGELGMEFRVNNPAGIRISRLGAFDHQGNGIQGTQNGGIRVAIFNKVTQAIVSGLEATVTGLADTLSAGHRLVNITPVTLLPGDYVVVAKGYNTGELNGNAGFGTPPGVVDSAEGAVSYVGGGLYGLSGAGAGLTYPANGDAGPASRYLAGTFQYSVVEKAGSRTVTITASDARGNTSTATAQVTVRDTLGACGVGSQPAATLSQPQRATEAEGTGSSVRLYPNPVRDRFSVQLSGMKGTKGTIEVVDINGRTIEQRAVNFGGGKAGAQTQAFSLQDQPSGVYFVRVRSEEGVRTFKVIVAR